jgi:hypothetical protein
MRRTIHEHNHLWWWNLATGVGFVLAAALLLRMLLNDWARLIPR